VSTPRRLGFAPRARLAVAPVVLPLLLPVGLVALWWWTSRESTSPLNPPLAEVVESLREDWLGSRVGSDLVPSLRRFAVGYLLGGTAGVALGTLIGLSSRLQRATQPVTELVRSIPSPLLFPFALVVFGIGDNSRVALIALGSLWPVLLNTVDGVRGVDPLVLDVGRSLGLRRRLQISHVILPAASPKIVAGLRVALSVALLLMVVSEMQGGTNGLGLQIRAAERSFDTAETYAGVLLIGVVGLAANLAFTLGERRIMRWHRGARSLLGETRGARP
jgi:ABC-type nitrate/sulfonate/bicarbonate transport system permease component